MTKKTPQRLLEGAYDLRTPEDNVEYYREFAARYEGEYARELGYQYPRRIAETFLSLRTDADAPVADIGCGTGLVAEHLASVGLDVDGMDISPEMLGIARGKTLYRELYEVDLTADLSGLPDDYGAVLSAGTFTHGHLGPEPLRLLLEIARPRALFCIGVNAEHYDKTGFADALAGMVDDRLITAPETRVLDMYSRTDHEHGGDQARALIFRRR